MYRRFLTLGAMVGLALGAATLAATPASASTATPTPAATVAPCPLTEAQLANGRALIASSQELLNHPALDNPGRTRPDLTPIENPIGGGADCELALADLKKKALDAKDALARYTQCQLGGTNGGRSCMAELDNLRAAAHELEVALNNLSNLCPWFIL
jgi:hypothetical protein